MGVLGVALADQEEPTAEEREIVDMLASHAAVAIGNARLFAESERRRRTAEALSEVWRFLSETFDVAALGLGGVTRIFRRDATKLGPCHPLEPFSLVFADPPYGKGLAEKALASARDGSWLKPEALIVVEEAVDGRECPITNLCRFARRLQDCQESRQQCDAGDERDQHARSSEGQVGEAEHRTLRRRLGRHHR